MSNTYEQLHLFPLQHINPPQSSVSRKSTHEATFQPREFGSFDSLCLTVIL